MMQKFTGKIYEAFSCLHYCLLLDGDLPHQLI